MHDGSRMIQTGSGSRRAVLDPADSHLKLDPAGPPAPRDLLRKRAKQILASFQPAL